MEDRVYPYSVVLDMVIYPTCVLMGFYWVDLCHDSQNVLMKCYHGHGDYFIKI